MWTHRTLSASSHQHHTNAHGQGCAFLCSPSCSKTGQAQVRREVCVGATLVPRPRHSSSLGVLGVLDQWPRLWRVEQRVESLSLPPYVGTQKTNTTPRDVKEVHTTVRTHSSAFPCEEKGWGLDGQTPSELVPPQYQTYQRSVHLVVLSRVCVCVDVCVCVVWRLPRRWCWCPRASWRCRRRRCARSSASTSTSR